MNEKVQPTTKDRNDMTEMEKLKAAFQEVTDRIISNEENELELRRALGDSESVMKSHIKIGMLRHTQEILEFCHLKIQRGEWV